MTGPVVVGGPVLGQPVVIGSGGPGLGRPVVVGPVQAGPVVVGGGGWQQTEEPIERPTSGGTRPVIEGHGPPPDFIPGARVGDYYLDVDSGYLYRLGGS